MDDSDMHHERRGLPVYFERGPRAISDPADPVPAGEWHPANDATRKLWACVEAVRDIDEALPVDAAPIQTRRLKALVVPLDSLKVGLTRLGNYLCTSDEAKRQLPKAVRSRLNGVLEEFRGSPSFRDPVDFRLLRDKLAAHVDSDIESWSAQEMLSGLKPKQFGVALHEALTLLVSLLGLDVYAWTASDCPDGCVRLMAVEPSLTTLRMEDGRPVELLALDFAVSPRLAIHDLCESIARRSLWMLEEGEA